MPKGIVLEINEKDLVVLTPDGAFERAKRVPGAKVGEEVEFTPIRSSLRPSRWARWTSIAACGLLAAGLWSYWNFTSQNKVFAYVALDINPSIELGINKSGSVLTATALNDDGKSILTSLKLQGDTVQEAVVEITTIAAKKGYVHQNSDVVITTTPAVSNGSSQEVTRNDTIVESNELNSIQDSLVASAQKTLDSLTSDVHVDGIQVSPKFHDAALSYGLPPAKYAFYLKAIEKGYAVTLDELKHASRYQVAMAHGIPEDLLRGETAESLDNALSSVPLRKTPESGKGNPANSNASDSEYGNANSSAGGSTGNGAGKGTGVAVSPSKSSEEGQPSDANRKGVSGDDKGSAKHGGLIDTIRKKLHLKQDKSSIEKQGDHEGNSSDTESGNNHKDQSPDQDKDDHPVKSIQPIVKGSVTHPAAVGDSVYVNVNGSGNGNHKSDK